MATFIFKVFILSAVIAIAVKYGGPLLLIPVGTTAALLGVWLPPILMAIVLGWRWQHLQQLKSKQIERT